MMNITLQPVLLNDRARLEKLLQEYLKENSQYDDRRPNEFGIFPYAYLPDYWVDPNRHPLFIYKGNFIIGFILINDFCIVEILNANLSIAEFYIQPAFRRKGWGRAASFLTFDQYPGTWEVRQDMKNIRAQLFWKKVIGEYTKENFIEKEVVNSTCQQKALIFQSNTK